MKEKHDLVTLFVPADYNDIFDMDELEEWIAMDDVKGVPLRVEGVRKARREEMEYFRKMNVYDVVDRSDMDPDGKMIEVKWVDTNKGDSEKENLRSRLVGKEFRDHLRCNTASRDHARDHLNSSQQPGQGIQADGQQYPEGLLLCTRQAQHLHRAPRRG